MLFEKLYTILTLMTMGLFLETADGLWAGGGRGGRGGEGEEGGEKPPP